MKVPEEIRIGTAKPIMRVASLSGLGSRAGVRVASNKPSECSNATNSLEKTP
jgi:hypothetical protein